ncbi:MAG TPA: hypothetical protein VMJ10_20415 [Kofleriaceae bacterium]|nr:hypothetical protein [Kofleriaceae bacterium]
MSSSRARLVVAHPERKAQRALQRLVGASLCPVEVVSDVASLCAAVDRDAIAVVDAGIARATPELCERPGRAWIAVPGEGLAAAEADAVAALLAAGWRHVIAHPMPLLAEELLATVQKLVRADVFGVEKYVAWGAEVRDFALVDTRDRDEAVTALAKDVVAVGLPERIGSLVSVIADELLANALFAAPVDDSGARFRARDPRDQPRVLGERERVTARWATDARYLAIEVRDRWGSIDLRAIGPRLAEVGKGKGATGSDGGMGLALAYACCNQLVIGCRPGELTEVIALVDVRYKPTELGRAGSFHAFTGTST